MNQPKAHDWRIFYTAAMLESDSTRIRQQIESAYQAIYSRLRELPETIGIHLEKAELQYALKYLGLLKTNLSLDPHF